MPIGSINFTNISNNKKSAITSNDIILYTNNDKLYFKNQEILDKGNQNEITELGTIISGVWQGTDIASDYITDTLTNKTLIEPIINKSGISDNTLLVGENISGDFKYKELQIGSGLNFTGSDADILKINLDQNTNTTYNSFSSNAYWTSPPFINNAMDNVSGYQTMNLAYQNLAVEFDHFILPRSITATNLTLIQAEESTTTYDINIINSEYHAFSDNSIKNSMLV